MKFLLTLLSMWLLAVSLTGTCILLLGAALAP